MTYARPAYDQADATWQGVDTYSHPPHDQADATWQGGGQPSPDPDPPPDLPWQRPNIVATIQALHKTALKGSKSTVTRMSAARSSDGKAATRFERATHAPHVASPSHRDAGTADTEQTAPWQPGMPRQRVVQHTWLESTGRDTEHSALWGRAQPKDRANYIATWNPKPGQADAATTQAWFSVDLYGSPAEKADQGPHLQTDLVTGIRLHGTSELAPTPSATGLFFRFGPEPVVRRSTPNDSSYGLTARQATARDDERAAPWGYGRSVWAGWNLPYPVEPNEDEPDEPTEPPTVRKVYIIMNTLDITDVATGTPLDVQDVTIGLDIDSLSWTFTGTLYGRGSLDLVRPDSQGMKDIDITINGHSWRFAIERYTSTERFPTQRYRITGVSRTQYMAAPNAPARTYENDSTLSAIQAANNELELTGYTLDWPTGDDHHLPDWSIPAGAFSYRDRTPAQSIAQIVRAAGGVMIPLQDADGWSVQPRYPVPPWQWSTATPDAEIHESFIRSRSARYEPGPEYNACYVSGINQGVAVDVQRQGSGGTQPAPDVLDDLITDTQPAISRGRQEIAASGSKSVEDIEIPIPEGGQAPGVLLPGRLVKIRHDDEALDYLGLVIATRIRAQRAGGAAVYQTITLETNA